jgi:cytochrome c2
MPGDIMVCSCGWRPPAWTFRNAIEETRKCELEAQRHWRKCQLVHKWKPGGTEHRQALGKVLGRKTGQQNNAAAVQRHREIAALPTAAKRSMHDVDLDRGIEKGNTIFYKCKACGGIYALT